ncbi:MAG: cytidylyltransferase domain-containing protein [Promethearchaeota archaeon]
MNIGVFITVRLGSTRLANKALLKIKGKPTIIHLIERIKHAKNLDKIVLCTTNKPEDKKIIKLAIEQNISYFAGNEKDILKRHFDAAVYHDIDFVINVDGDDLFCDPEYIDEIAKIAREENNSYDVIQTEGLPFGVNSFGYKVLVLKKILESKNQNDTETGWGEFFIENKNLKKKIIFAKENHQFKDKNNEPRMSLDYKEDFEFFERIINQLYREGEYFSLDEILEFLRNNPEIIKISKDVEKKYWEHYENEKVLKSKGE